MNNEINRLHCLPVQALIFYNVPGSQNAPMYFYPTNYCPICNTVGQIGLFTSYGKFIRLDNSSDTRLDGSRVYYKGAMCNKCKSKFALKISTDGHISLVSDIHDVNSFLKHFKTTGKDDIKV